MLIESRTINFFWGGRQLNDLEFMSLNSFYKNGYECKFWAYDSFCLPKHVKFCDANFILSRKVYDIWLSNIKGDHKFQTFSNYFRYKLIYKMGGWWSDLDIICLKELPIKSYVFTSVDDIPLRQELINHKEYLHPHKNIANGFFKSKIKSCFLKSVIAEIESNDIPQKFGEIGTIIFTNNIVKFGFKNYIIPNMIGYGINYYNKQYSESLDIPNSYVLHFYNYLIKPTLKKDSLYSKLRKIYL